MDIRKKIEGGQWCVGYYKDPSTGVGKFYLMARIEARAKFVGEEESAIALMGREPIVSVKGKLKKIIGKISTLDEIKQHVEAELVETLINKFEQSVSLVHEKKKLYGKELESVTL